MRSLTTPGSWRWHWFYFDLRLKGKDIHAVINQIVSIELITLIQIIVIPNKRLAEHIQKNTKLCNNLQFHDELHRT